MKALFQLPDKPDILEEAEIARLTGHEKKHLQILWLESHGWLFEKNRSGKPIVSRLYFQMRLAGIDASSLMPQKPWEPDFNALS